MMHATSAQGFMPLVQLVSTHFEHSRGKLGRARLWEPRAATAGCTSQELACVVDPIRFVLDAVLASM